MGTLTAQRGDSRSPDPRIHFLGLGFVADEEEVRRRISIARFSGATEAECAEALKTWERMTAESVQRIESQPTPAARCLCSHAKHRGRCPITVCGCREHRPANTQRATDAPSVTEYLRSRGELA